MTPDLSHLHLFERELYAHEHLQPVEPKYAIVYENPDDPEASCCIVHPAPWMLAMLMAGGYQPPIEAHFRDQAKIANWIAEGNDPQKFSFDQVGGAEHPHCAPMTEPMTEEQAMEYIMMKDVPQHVWAVERNRPYVKIVRREMVPADRTYRNAWRMAA